ncbi:unnamed protein product [Ambrosiozyma monospora]|uniref:Unnamed protein product n=1 Tax=Ambrosiozyma monospora TaxID=43982 RepID=A0A9W7DK57_AMBMO|nr:unnamed protein product [Ambrosiozyma monospora]
MTALNSLACQSSVRARFRVRYQNKNKFFTSQLNTVKGSAEVYFKENLNNVYQIDMGLKGDIRSKCRSSQQNTTNYNIDILFNESKTLFTEHNGQTTSFPKNSVIEYPISFVFPSNDISLPSSCENILTADGRSSITVRYELYLRFSIKDQPEEFLDLLVPLKFQGDSVSIFHSEERRSSNIPALSATFLDWGPSDSHWFLHKPALYLPNYETGTMMELPPDSESTSNRSLLSKYTRPTFVKKLFNSTSEVDNRNVDIYPDIPLDVSLDFGLQDSFDITNQLGDIPLKFTCESDIAVSDLKYNGMSTGLGSFKVTSCFVSLMHEFNVHGSADLVEQPLCEHEGTNLFGFDLKDFQYDARLKVWALKTTLNEIINNTTTLFDCLSEPVMGNTTISNYFASRSVIKVSLLICSDIPFSKNVKNNQVETYQMSSPISLSCHFEPQKLKKLEMLKYHRDTTYHVKTFTIGNPDTTSSCSANQLSKNLGVVKQNGNFNNSLPDGISAMTRIMFNNREKVLPAYGNQSSIQSSIHQTASAVLQPVSSSDTGSGAQSILSFDREIGSIGHTIVSCTGHLSIVNVSTSINGSVIESFVPEKEDENAENDDVDESGDTNLLSSDIPLYGATHNLNESISQLSFYSNFNEDYSMSSYFTTRERSPVLIHPLNHYTTSKSSFHSSYPSILQNEFQNNLPYYESGCYSVDDTPDVDVAGKIKYDDVGDSYYYLSTNSQIS